MSKLLKKQKEMLPEENSYHISQMKASIDSLIATHAANAKAHQDLDADLMIGVGNAEYVALSINSSEPRAAALHDALGYRNAGATDFYTTYDLTIPTNRGGLKLYALSWAIIISDADVDDYVTHIYLYARDEPGWHLPEQDATDLKTIDTHEYVFGAAADLSVGENWMLFISNFCTGAHQLDVHGISLKVYYDT